MYCFEAFLKKCYHVTQADLKLTILLPQPLGTGITDICGYGGFRVLGSRMCA